MSIATLAAALASVSLAGTSSADASSAPPTMAGAWAPLNRCPVDDPAMLAADGASLAALCLSSTSASGSIKLGDTTLPTGNSDVQFGTLSTGNSATPVAPSAGAVLADPVQIPGGLLGLMCPSDIPFVSDICARISDGYLNGVTATLVAAGAPTEFDATAGLGVDLPIVRLPVKIRLSNPFLGSNCTIGSDADPIVLRPRNLARPTARMVRFDADGSPNTTGEMFYVRTVADQADSTFAVPGADGCGLFGLLNGAVNLKQGLPSPSGENSVVLSGATTSYGGFVRPPDFAPNQGRELAARWHAAVTG